jgi:hypothetical protein
MRLRYTTWVCRWTSLQAHIDLLLVGKISVPWHAYSLRLANIDGRGAR